MRTWICPECGRAEEVSYDRLAEHGKPACEKCERDMELQPETEATADAAVVERLVNKAEAAGLEAEDLDETVHNLVSGIASDINNEGMDGQIQYLVKAMGVQRAEQEINRRIEVRPNKTE